jgi:hypothetical protein
LFEETPEQETTKIRFAPVETEGEFIEVGLKVIRLYGSLMGSEQPSFQETRNAVNRR